MIIVIIFLILASVIFFFIKIDNTLLRSILPSITMSPIKVAQTTTEIPIDCVVSAWSNWSNCSANCSGGIQERTRSIITMPKGNGISCPVLKETRACNTDACPVDCQVSDWSNWSNCTENCGGGVQERTRNIITMPRGNGISCPVLKETRACNTDACPVLKETKVAQTTEEIPIDCVVSDWSNWSNCSVNCGGGTQERTRSIITMPRGNGVSCPVLKETIACNTDVCPVDCKVSNWSNWSNCTENCDGGTQERTRSIITMPRGNGTSCPLLKETIACNTDVCPVDCNVSDWSNWSNCSVSCGSGWQERERNIITQPKGTGTKCPELTDTRACNTNVCPVDCKVSDWSNWSNCSVNCGGGTQERTRTVITAQKGTGIACPELKDTRACNTDVCPVDCKVSDWSNWSNCSVNCGGGTQERTRTVITAQKGTGISCPELRDTRVCNTDVCPVDCVVSDWSNWSNCSVSCGGGTQERTRSIITMPKGNGIACPILKDTRACNTDVCPVNCVVGEWSNWGTCTKSCGGGLQERTRSIITQPQGNGTSCPEVRQTRECNTDVCPVDCQVSDWANWSACPTPCGGTQERRRSIITQPKGTGNQCPELTEIKKCVECPLYEFTSHTFTTAGKFGPFGPTLVEVRTAYSGVYWAQNNEFLNMTTQGIQLWKVPKSGTYKIRAKGAGGGGQYTWSFNFSRGRDIEVTVSLTRGEIIYILVGQVARMGLYGCAGGGGGTFVVKGDMSNPNPILVAGGGGGLGDKKSYNYGIDLNSRSDAAPLNTTNGNDGCGLNTYGQWYFNYGVGGRNGNGGENTGNATGGAGLLGDASTKATYYTLVDANTTAKSFKNGGTGANPTSRTSASYGGFGGGGAAENGGMGGGGGGYSGGGAGGMIGDPYGTLWAHLNGGGGGSYGIKDSIDYGATNTGYGSVTITLI
jgi:hypothetical protein